MTTPTLTRLQTALFVIVIAACGLSAAPALHSVPDTTADHALSALIRGERARQFETHYDATFPLKRFAVNVWAAISLKLFGEGRPGVVIGRDGWLFSDEEFRVTDDSAAQVAANLALIAEVHRELTRQGLPLLVIVVPSKARVEAAHLGERRPAGLHVGLHDRLIESLAIAGIPTVDLLQRLTEAGHEQPVFLRGDTHWTPFGAAQAARHTAVIAAERHWLDPLPATAAETRRPPPSTRPHRGDLYQFLPLDPWFSAWLPPPEPIETRAAIDDPTTVVAASDLFGNRNVAKIVLIGTSYSANPAWNFDGALARAFGEPISNLAREGRGPFVPMQQYLAGPELAALRPRLVLWEIPERSLLMAPVEGPLPVQQAAAGPPGATAD